MGYVSKTPASGRPALTAAMSLCMAYREDRLPRVAETWQTLAALPHAVIIHTATGRAMLVLLSARYAMRTWPATVVTKPHTGKCVGDSGIDNDTRWVFNKAERWEWMSVWDINEWLYQPHYMVHPHGLAGHRTTTEFWLSGLPSDRRDSAIIG